MYDSNGRLASVTDNDGEGGSPFRTNSYTWTNGLVLAHTDPRGVATTNTCDALGRLIQVSDALGAVTNTYDKLDLIKTVDRMGFTRTNLYNAFRQLVRSVDARDHTIFYGYCNCGLLDSMTDRAGNTTIYTYDNAGKRLKTTFPGGSWLSNCFDLAGQLLRVTDSADVYVTNSYDSSGLLLNATTAGGQLLGASYDVLNRTVQSTDANGVTVTNLFDALGRVFVRGLQATNSTEGFAWSARGLLRYTNQLGHVTTNGYDALGRKVGETNANGEAVRFTYAPGGELLTLTDGKSQVTTWSYDLSLPLMETDQAVLTESGPVSG